MKKLIKQMAELSANINQSEKQNLSISNANIGWQIDHSLRVINQVISSLLHSNPAEYKPAFNWRKSIVLFFKKIPRGKVKAPKGILPTEEITQLSLKESLDQARQNLILLEKSEPMHFFVHPFFGQVNVRDTIVFIEVHTEHHLKIIRDICK
jgi:hypothetical protein